MMGKIYHANTIQRKAQTAILISDKAHLKPRKLTRDKKECYIMIKGSIFQNNLTILNASASNDRASN